MAANEIINIIVALLSLTFPIAAYTQNYYRPTPTPPTRQHMNDASARNRFYDMSASITSTQAVTSSINDKQREESSLVYPEEQCMFGLCINVPQYPNEKIQNILNRSQAVNGYFGISEESVIINNRFNSDEMSLCETKVHTIYPEKANNTMKVEKVIVNVEGHKQGIVFETCVQDKGKCKFSSSFPTGYTSFCKQKYIHKKLMVLGDNDKVVFDLFEVPSCCVCTYTRNN